jgi:hypothetical protein
MGDWTWFDIIITGLLSGGAIWWVYYMFLTPYTLDQYQEFILHLKTKIDQKVFYIKPDMINALIRLRGDILRDCPPEVRRAKLIELIDALLELLQI